jgi:hypothetical protein
MSAYRRAEVKLHALTLVLDGNEAEPGHSDYWEELLALSDRRLNMPQKQSGCRVLNPKSPVFNQLLNELIIILTVNLAYLPIG